MKPFLRIYCVILSLAPLLSMSASGIFNISTAATATEQSYVKVTEAPADWSGTYLIVCETESIIFDGSLADLDVANSYQSVTITDGVITGNYAGYAFTVASVTGGYSIQSASGLFIGKGAEANGLECDPAFTDSHVNTISLAADGVNIIAKGGRYLRFNTTAGQDRFRYYSSSYGKAVSLYRLDSGTLDPSKLSLEITSLSLVLENTVEINSYFTVNDMSLFSAASEVGYYLWEKTGGEAAPDAVPAGTPATVVSDGFAESNYGYYVSQGARPAKEQCRSYWVCVYARYGDTYVYSNIAEHSIYAYQAKLNNKIAQGATTIAGHNAQDLKATVDALLLYAEAAAKLLPQS